MLLDTNIMFVGQVVFIKCTVQGMFHCDNPVP